MNFHYCNPSVTESPYRCSHLNELDQALRDLLNLFIASGLGEDFNAVDRARKALASHALIVDEDDHEEDDHEGLDPGDRFGAFRND